MSETLGALIALSQRPTGDSCSRPWLHLLRCSLFLPLKCLFPLVHDSHLSASPPPNIFGTVSSINIIYLNFIQILGFLASSFHINPLNTARYSLDVIIFIFQFCSFIYASGVFPGVQAPHCAEWAPLQLGSTGFCSQWLLVLLSKGPRVCGPYSWLPDSGAQAQ